MSMRIKVRFLEHNLNNSIAIYNFDLFDSQMKIDPLLEK